MDKHLASLVARHCDLCDVLKAQEARFETQEKILADCHQLERQLIHEQEVVKQKSADEHTVILEVLRKKQHRLSAAKVACEESGDNLHANELAALLGQTLGGSRRTGNYVGKP